MYRLAPKAIDTSWLYEGLGVDTWKGKSGYVKYFKYTGDAFDSWETAGETREPCRANTMQR